MLCHLSPGSPAVDAYPVVASNAQSLRKRQKVILYFICIIENIAYSYLSTWAAAHHGELLFRWVGEVVKLLKHGAVGGVEHQLFVAASADYMFRRPSQGVRWHWMDQNFALKRNPNIYFSFFL
jgi:hypothetical protein